MRDFDPDATVQLQAKAGRERGTVSLRLNDDHCDRTPSPTPVSPLPTPIPNPSLTLDDYSFSEPRVVLTDSVGLAVLDWLPDSRRAIISQNLYRILYLLDTVTGETVAYSADSLAARDPAVWLDGVQKIAFLGAYTPVKGESVAGKSTLYFSGGVDDLQKVVTDIFEPAIAGRDNRVMVLGFFGQTPQLLDGAGNNLSPPPINLNEYGINIRPTVAYTVLRWHPYEPKVAIFDSGGFIVFNIETGDVRPYMIGEVTLTHGFGGRPTYALRGEWSPDGNQMALVLTQDNVPIRWAELAILDMATGKIKLITLPLNYIADIAWAPNSRQLIVEGSQRQDRGEDIENLYLVDAQTGASRKIDQASGILLSSDNSTVAWSPDGQRLLYRCRLPNVHAGACESLAMVKGGQ